MEGDEMDREYILTVDAGTTGCKCTVFDASGEAIRSVKREYPTEYPKPNWSEQDADRVLAAIHDGIRELLEQVRAEQIACVGLSGTMNGLIPVDKNGAALHRNILHSDSRAQSSVKKMQGIISPEAFYDLTGNRLDHHFTLPKIVWLREHMPDIDRRARWYLNTKDYIYGHFTGHFGVTDYSDASLTTALNIRKKVWAEDLLQSLDIPLLKMPELRRGSDVTGQVNDKTARETGLLTGTPVAVGGGDGACAGRGAGVSAAGSAYCYIGSSAWISQLNEMPLFDPKMRVYNILDLDGESCYIIGVIQCGAAAYDWALTNFLGAFSDDGAFSGREYSAVENMARQIEPGSEGVLFMPTLMSERTPYWDANTRGVLMGFSLYHDRRHIARAIYEGVAFQLNHVVEILNELGAPAKSMMLTGGGARSGLWPDIMAGVFGVETRVHQTPGESTSLGAAIAAGVGVGIYPSFEEASRIVRERSVHPVNPAWADRYREVFAIYSSIYERLKPVYDGIARIV